MFAYLEQKPVEVELRVFCIAYLKCSGSSLKSSWASCQDCSASHCQDLFYFEVFSSTLEYSFSAFRRSHVLLSSLVQNEKHILHNWKLSSLTIAVSPWQVSMSPNILCYALHDVVFAKKIYEVRSAPQGIVIHLWLDEGLIICPYFT